MRTLSLVLIAGVTACSVAPRPGPVHGEVVLTVQGKVKNGPFLFGREDLGGLPKRSSRSSPPASPPAVFEGVSLAALLSERMEPVEGVDAAIIRGRDGYAVGVPLIVIKQFKPVLADRAAGKLLAEWARSAGVQAKAFFLAWPNLDWPGFDSDPRVRSWWASDVDSVELVRWDETYGKALRVPPGAADDARLGSEAYSFHCIACHRIRGVGGARGPEIAGLMKGKDPTPLIERYRAHAFAMGLPTDPPQGSESLRQIASFLRSVQLAGPALAEDVRGEEGTDAAGPDGGAAR